MPKILKGLKSLRVFPIVANDHSTYTPGAGVIVPGIQSLTLDPDVSEWKINADDTVYDSGADWNGMNLSLTLAELPLELHEHFEGGTYDSETGEYVYTTNDVAPEIGMSFMAQTSDGNYRMVRLFALRCNKVSGEFRTKGEGDSATPITIEGAVTSRKTDNAVRAMKDSTTNADLTWVETLINA